MEQYASKLMAAGFARLSAWINWEIFHSWRKVLGLTKTEYSQV